MPEAIADIALIGLAVMGQNVILNMNDHGFVVCAFNRTIEKVDQFLNNEAKGTNVVGARSYEEMVKKLKKPRRIMLLVKVIIADMFCTLPNPVFIMQIKVWMTSMRFTFLQAGAAVDSFIEKLVPLLESGDIIIDGGNSEYQDTARRVFDLEKKGKFFNANWMLWNCS